MDVTLEESKIIVAPAAEPLLTLESLLKGITDENIHQEVDTGPAVGSEGLRPADACLKYSGAAGKPDG